MRFARQLHKFEEDLNVMIGRQQLKESLLMEEIASLKAKLGEGGSGRQGGPSSLSGSIRWCFPNICCVHARHVLVR